MIEPWLEPCISLIQRESMNDVVKTLMDYKTATRRFFGSLPRLTDIRKMEDLVDSGEKSIRSKRPSADSPADGTTCVRRCS